MSLCVCVCVCLSVCVLVTRVDCAKTAEDIDLPFGTKTPLDQGNILLNWMGWPQGGQDFGAQILHIFNTHGLAAQIDMSFTGKTHVDTKSVVLDGGRDPPTGSSL